MRATILDTVTGEKMTVDGPRSWEWAENNWSCDCNRNPWGVDTGKPEGVCGGCERFLVVDAVSVLDDPDDYKYTLDELNAGYPAELRARFLNKTTIMKPPPDLSSTLEEIASQLEEFAKGAGRNRSALIGTWYHGQEVAYYRAMQLVFQCQDELRVRKNTSMTREEIGIELLDTSGFTSKTAAVPQTGVSLSAHTPPTAPRED